MAIDGRFPLYEFSIQKGASSYSKTGEIIDDYLSSLISTAEFAILKK